jgi:hypothetical protein
MKDDCPVCDIASEVLFRIDANEKNISKHEAETDRGFEKVRAEMHQDRVEYRKSLGKIYWGIITILATLVISIGALVVEAAIK